MGWAIQDLIYFIVGEWITGAVLLSLLTFTGLATLGLRRNHLIQAMEGLRGWLLNYAGTQPAPAHQIGGDGLAEAESLPFEIEEEEDDDSSETADITPEPKRTFEAAKIKFTSQDQRFLRALKIVI